MKLEFQSNLAILRGPGECFKVLDKNLVDIICTWIGFYVYFRFTNLPLGPTFVTNFLVQQKWVCKQMRKCQSNQLLNCVEKWGGISGIVGG